MQALSGAVCYVVDGAKISCAVTSVQHVLMNQVTVAVRAAGHDETYNSVYASVRCPFDISMHQRVQARVAEVGKIDYCMVIGIGGSSLGFRAVYDALQDTALIRPHNLCVLETVDSASVIAALSVFEQVLINRLRVHICVISKSGTTTETIALWRVIQPILQKYHPMDWINKVTIITDTGSPLEHYAQEHNLGVLTIPALVGGRYSVLSPVGLFPLALCGIATVNFITGASEATVALLQDPVQNGMPIAHATALFAAYQHSYQVHDTFIFSAWCATIGLWYRQLAAESLGKLTIHGRTRVSMIPTVSVGSTDLHSMGQLYLSGADNFWTTFIFMDEQSRVHTMGDDSLNSCVPSLNNRSLDEIMTAIEQGTVQAYQESGVPFSIVTLKNRSPYTIGYLMQSYMLAVMYAGALFEVNSFDQPDVERYKKITRELLLKS